MNDVREVPIKGVLNASSEFVGAAMGRNVQITDVCPDAYADGLRAGECGLCTDKETVEFVAQETGTTVVMYLNEETMKVDPLHHD